MTKLHLIWNPVAGNGAALSAHEIVVRELDARGVNYTESKSEYPGHATELAHAAAAGGAECVVALGGDGTVREVASALFQTDVHMGIIPCGTGNDIVRPLGIPSDPLRALDVVLEDNVRHMDAAKANDELYFNVAGFGFDVDVLDYTEIYKKKMKSGKMAYRAGLFKALAGRRNRRTTITWPDGQMTKDILIMAAGNGTHFGGGMMVTPQADPFDGLLDVCVISNVNWVVLLPMLLRFMQGKHIGSKYVQYFTTTELTAVCEPPSRIDVDGEILPGTPVTFRILPKSLWVVVPM